MSRTNSRSLVDRGRKAGLTTSELYRALAGQAPSAEEVRGRDCNGFAIHYDSTGRAVYRSEPPR